MSESSTVSERERPTGGSPPRSIHRLDELTISRIAAGEVVERPASVVKELVENSIDAGATRIDVTIREGGRSWISISDDGSGIPADEIELAVERHATSKLDDELSLASIRTLGFRGEALAAICSVARVSLISRPEDAADGRRVVVEGGRLVEQGPAGAPIGTRITVEHLFRDVPARREFLNSDAAESGRVTEIVTQYALAYPNIRFTLDRNDRRVLDSPGRGGLKAAIGAVFGAEVARDLLEIAYSESYDGSGSQDRMIRVRGAAGSAHLHRANRRGITLFVNGRLVKDARLTAAVVQAYRTRIPERRYPIAVVSIELPPEAVDVNVHPAKTEVRFKAPDRMFGVVRDAVIGSLGAGRIGASLDKPFTTSRHLWRPQDFDPSNRIAEVRSKYDFVESSGDGEAPHTIEGWDVGPADQGTGPSDRLPPLRVLGQIARCYIVAEGPDALYLIDQHAAHERIVFEMLLARTGSPASQTLLEPLVVELSADEAEAFGRLGQGLEKIGFLVEAFGDAALILRAVPEILSKSEPAALLRGVLQGADEDEVPVERAVEERLARAACKRGSVKAGQALTYAEIRALVGALEQCHAPHTCPHGRPTVIVLGADFIERSFGRR